MPYDLEGEFDKEFGTSAPQHEGMFGIKGLGRNILGVLGDAFLMQAGRDPIYRQKVQQEQMGDALSGFTDNPLAAIQRLADLGQGKVANELFDSYSERGNNAIKTRAQADRDTAAAANDQYDLENNRLNNLRGLLSTADATSYPALLAIARRRAQQDGVDISMLPDQYDKGMLDAFVEAGIRPEKRMEADALERYRLAQTILKGGDLKVEAAKVGANVADDIADNAANVADIRMDAENVKTGANRAATQQQNADTARIRATKGKGTTSKGSASAPPRDGRFVGEKAVSSAGQTFVWNGKKWAKQ